MIDAAGRTIDYMRISITDRCNLRCRYCMPDGITQVAMSEILTYEEIKKICTLAEELGIRKIKITGGEPLVRKGCVDLIGMIKEIPGIIQVTMTTNGVLLKENLKALKDAGLWEKIQKLPQKEKTFIGKEVSEDGIHLSGGETQKLMLARALYKGCALLLLDEPTAALDAIAENEMYEKYNEMLTGKTALFISHRLASTRFCDHILFLENGKITEEGTHEELMQKNGGYAEMFLVQSRYYKEEGAQSHEEDMAGI